MTPDILSVSEVARRLTEQLGREIRPRAVTMIFYHRLLSDDLAPVVSGRRMIHIDLLCDIARVLRRKGWIGRPVETVQ